MPTKITSMEQLKAEAEQGAEFFNPPQSRPSKQQRHRMGC